MTCLSSDEEEIVAKAASSLQNIPIIWFRKVRLKKSMNRRGVDSTANQHHRDCNKSFKKHAVNNEQGFFVFSTTRSTTNTTTSSSNASALLNKPSSNSTSAISSTVAAAADGGQHHQQQQEEDTEGEGRDDTITYAKFDAILNVCDTDSGPAIELRTTSKNFSKELEEHYSLADMDEKMDTILNLSAGDSSKCFLERIIPLDMIGHAAHGGKWELDNILQVGSGDFHCGIKVYSPASDFQLIGHGKKVLLFDLMADGSPLDRDEVISYINALSKWNTSRLAYSSQVKDDDPCHFFLKNFCC